MMSLEAELTAVISAEALVPSEILSSGASMESLGLASIDLVSVLFEIEDRYGITFAEGEVSTTTTIREIFDLVQAKCEARKAAT
jgi:acyl carrier protein